jgi:hypothetical protein
MFFPRNIPFACYSDAMELLSLLQVSNIKNLEWKEGNKEDFAFF